MGRLSWKACHKLALHPPKCQRRPPPNLLLCFLLALCPLLDPLLCLRLPARPAPGRRACPSLCWAQQAGSPGAAPSPQAGCDPEDGRSRGSSSTGARGELGLQRRARPAAPAPFDNGPSATYGCCRDARAQPGLPPAPAPAPKRPAVPGGGAALCCFAASPGARRIWESLPCPAVPPQPDPRPRAGRRKRQSRQTVERAGAPREPGG